MNLEEIRNALCSKSEDCVGAMFRYGNTCGLDSRINFSAIKAVFSQIAIGKNEEDAFMGMIIDGYRAGSEFDTTLFFG